MYSSTSSSINQRSPKRKRSDYSINTQPPPSRLKTTTLPVRSSVETVLGSPQTMVTREFQNLDLAKEAPKTSFDLHAKLGESTIMHGESTADRGSDDQTELPTISCSNSSTTTMLEPLPSARFAFDTASDPPLESSSSFKLLLDTVPDPPLEIPETPRLQPVPFSSPLPSRADTPPPFATLWWKDAEITGHDPQDPTDDGYGINGIGFLPTPSIAKDRAERRKRQVAEWRSREAKEARQKRSDRRRWRGAGSEGSIPMAAGLMNNEVRKVRFLEA